MEDLTAHPGLRPVLALLLGHWHCAALKGIPAWEFGVPPSLLVRAGAGEDLLQVMPAAGHLERRVTPGPGGGEWVLALTDGGAALAAALALEPLGPPGAPAAEEPLPCWRGDTRELWLGGLLVKRVPKRATNQILLLSSFEECRWQNPLDDPLPGGRTDGPQRLREAVRALNRSQCNRLLVFDVEHGSRSLLWRYSQGHKLPPTGQ